ncbi:helix-turn-helix transcriptional regulator [Chryseobacterium caseinilyticum]|uniref:WYL domain-containing protein n=1 Tax=Chryseobacterium caseinilyticum TaxID=2771428 RepID=A0ABR8Z832_9FLAO|nr:WYL domain-containing protein [Chryseobacterium caseinilyticum]MBD8081455.1 WYL domain-containing protein [Chryseobacterium caseinilyticum]
MKKYSSSTFEKDKTAIFDLWKIEIKCDNYNRYSIHDVSESIFQNDLMNSAIFLASLNSDMLLPGFVIPETRQNTGIDYFHVISEAIEAKKKLKISYFDYISQNKKEKIINPYRLKQKDFKWYVLADDEKDPAIPFKSYALERIRKIEEAGRFRPQNIDFETPYKNAMGMFTNGEPEKMILEYDLRDGNYLKANPIHQSQTIVSENKENIQFEFFVKPNENFLMELMKRSWSLKIIEPISLKEKIRSYWERALERNG